MADENHLPLALVCAGHVGFDARCDGAAIMLRVDFLDSDVGIELGNLPSGLVDQPPCGLRDQDFPVFAGDQLGGVICQPVCLA